MVLAQQPAQGARSKQIDATTWYVADERFTGSVFADVNRDGYPDLVLVPGPYAPNGFVFLNDGHGDFSKRPPIELPPGAYGGNWLVANVDANGWFASPQARAPVLEPSSSTRVPSTSTATAIRISLSCRRWSRTRPNEFSIAVGASRS